MKIPGELVEIPEADPLAAREILDRHFDENGDLRVVAMRPRITEIEQGLYNLCSELVDRYYVVFTFGATPGTPVQMSYSYRQLSLLAGPVGGTALRTGSEDSAFSVPGSYSAIRICDSYSFSMDAPDGYYFYEERVLEQKVASESHGNENSMSATSNDVFTNLENVPADGLTVTREKGGGTSAYLFVREGRSRRKTLFAGFASSRFRRAPPGGSSFFCLLG